MPFLPPNQQCHSTEGKSYEKISMGVTECDELVLMAENENHFFVCRVTCWKLEYAICSYGKQRSVLNLHKITFTQNGIQLSVYKQADMLTFSVHLEAITSHGYSSMQNVHFVHILNPFSITK